MCRRKGEGGGGRGCVAVVVVVVVVVVFVVTVVVLVAVFTEQTINHPVNQLNHTNQSTHAQTNQLVGSDSSTMRQLLMCRFGLSAEYGVRRNIEYLALAFWLSCDRVMACESTLLCPYSVGTSNTIDSGPISQSNLPDQPNSTPTNQAIE